MEWVLSTHGSKMAAGVACSYLAGKPFFSGIKLAAALENGHDSTHNMQPGARRTACHAVHSMQRDAYGTTATGGAQPAIATAW